MKACSVLVALVLTVLGPAVGAAPSGPVARTTLGELRGLRTAGVESFLGVPFAQAPVGNRRWRDPVAVSAWTGIRDATRPAPACYQPRARPFGPYTAEFLIDPEVSEDCLYLNVWKPTHLATHAPVLVWIHGGGFGSGSGSIPIYDGAALARRGVVVVTINYRLGVFGFLASRELTEESGRQTSGNYGLLDQIAALRWVRSNIAAFGGDPGNVTIAGQSAGAASVADLIASPLARELFHRAIAQSGFGMGVGMPTLAEAETTGQRVLSKAGVRDIAGLRALPAEGVLAAADLDQPKPGAMPTILFAPNRDGVAIVGDPRDGASPIQSAVPLLTGFNADEGAPAPSANIAIAFEAMVRERYGASAERLLALYPHGEDREAADSWVTLARDRYMASLLIWLQARTAARDQRVYAYLFDYPYPGSGWNGTPSAFHTAEVPYVFGTVGRSGQPLSTSDRAMEATVQSAWIAFMRSGQPQIKGRIWPATGMRSTNVMVLGHRPGMRAAVSTPARLAALQEFVAEGGSLSLF